MNWEQLKTVLWLRWRLTRRQWTRGGGLGAVIAAIVGVVLLIASAGSFVVALLAGSLALGDAPPTVIMTVWLVLTATFLFLWLIGLVTELQRSESIDLQRLMHLPVALGQIFVFNYAASHLALSIVLVVPAMIGLAVGLAVSRGAAMLLLIPLALGMIFMITAWTYCLRGWLATLMTNPRRRRAIVITVTAVVIVVAQAPNLYFNVFRRIDRTTQPAGETRSQRRTREAAERTAELEQLARFQAALPPLWVPVGARALAEGRVWPAMFGTLGLITIGTLGLRRAYRSTLRFYHGEIGGNAARVRRTRPATGAGPPARARSRFLERGLPGVPEQAAAVALATFRAMLRAPEIKMQWGTSFVVTLLVGAPLLFRSTSTLPDAATPFVATGVVVFSMFLMVGFGANQFGFDRDGFRAYVLSPADRQLILIGKNLAALPASTVLGVTLLLAVAAWLRLPALVFVAALLQLVVGLVAASIAGNLLSILVPYRIQAGSMKPTKMPPLAMVTMIVAQMSLPLALTPAFVPPSVGFFWERVGGPPAGLVNFGLSLVLALAMCAIYWWTIGPLGRLLQRRETRILATVSVDVE